MAASPPGSVSYHSFLVLDGFHSPAEGQSLDVVWLCALIWALSIGNQTQRIAWFSLTRWGAAPCQYPRHLGSQPATFNLIAAVSTTNPIRCSLGFHQSERVPLIWAPRAPPTVWPWAHCSGLRMDDLEHFESCILQHPDYTKDLGMTQKPTVRSKMPYGFA